MSVVHHASQGAAARRVADMAAWMERRWVVVAVHLALAAVVVSPIFSVTVLPLVDYPNHLARMYILAHWASDPALQQNYVVNWHLLPNMAMEAFVPFLARFMSIYTAGKLFAAAAILSIPVGTIALRKALVGKVGLWSALTFLLVYNQAFFWGFLNYLFTAGLALLVFAGWIALRERPWPLRAAIFSVAAVVLYAGHLFGLFVYGLLVLGYEVWRIRATPGPVLRRLRGGAEAGIQFVVPAALFVVWTIHNGSADGALTEFGSLRDRLAIFASLTNFNILAVDLPTLLFLACLWPLCRTDETVGLVPSMKIPALILAAIALVMPIYLSGVWGTHLRLPLILAAVLIAGTRITAPDWRPLPYIVGTTLALVLVRTALVTQDWRRVDGEFAEFRQATAAIGRGARLLPIGDLENRRVGGSDLYRMQFGHMASLAIIERSAFVPTEFTGFTMIGAADGVKAIDTPVGDPISAEVLAKYDDPAHSLYPLGHRFERYVWAFWVGWPATFDYAVSIRFSHTANPFPAHLKRLVKGTFFDVYRVVKPGAAPR